MLQSRWRELVVASIVGYGSAIAFELIPASRWWVSIAESVFGFGWLDLESANALWRVSYLLPISVVAAVSACAMHYFVRWRSLAASLFLSAVCAVVSDPVSLLRALAFDPSSLGFVMTLAVYSASAFSVATLLRMGERPVERMKESG